MPRALGFVLNTDVFNPAPSRPAPLLFCVTGPNRNVSEWKECVDKSVRIGLTIHLDGRHVFDDTWVVEQMPGPRCIFDGTLLPNGHIILTGGQKVRMTARPQLAVVCRVCLYLCE